MDCTVTDHAPTLCVESLYNEHHGWLRGWLRRRLGDTHQAADLAHDTFVRLLSREDTVVIHEPRAYLTTIAQRVMANHWRRVKLEQAYLEALALEPEAVALSAEDRTILLETLLEIATLLDGLPVLVKRAFLLTQLDGLNHAQVAEELGVSVTTVKRHIARAARQCYFPDALPVQA